VSLSSPFIRRPVGTTLLTIAVAMAGFLAFFFLPVSPIPQVEFPTIQVQAMLPGASPQIMASAVATPLERQFGRIAGITEMTSTSSLGSTSIALQFDLNRNIDAAARDVQAAINAARGQLPTNLPNNPTYRKVNPADAPMLILAMTSDTYDRGRMYDVASSILAQKLSQVEGVGQVNVGGSALPAVRVQVNPTQLNNYGLGLEDVRNALANANTNRPKGWISSPQRTYTLSTTDQLFKASEYKPLIIAYRHGAPVRLSDFATVTDDVEDVRTAGLFADKTSVSLIVFRQPGANMIETVDRVLALMPQLQAEIPAGMKMWVAMDRTTTVRASVHDVEWTLVVSTVLVILVVFLFLRSFRTTFIPSIAVPVSLVGTFGVMYLCGYTIDNLSLMALAIATGFVVDDAIVVIENISRHLEQGMRPFPAALLGAKEIGFTVLSMSTSLVAVFIPILLMGGIVGRLFREFAVTLSAAIGVSMIVSLTTTPMMCARLLKSEHTQRHGWLYRANERVFNWILRGYEVSLDWVMRHQPLMLVVTLGTIAFTVYLYKAIPKDFFPQQDTGRLMGAIQGDQDTSFQTMERLLAQYASVISQDPAVDSVVGFTGGRDQINVARMFVALKPLDQRKMSAGEVMGRLRAKTARIPGAQLVLQAVQDLRVGGRMSNAQYQFSLQGDNLDDLNHFAPLMLQAMRKIPGLADLNTDQQNRGLESRLTYDRTTASRLNVSIQTADATLYDAFGQRQVSTMFTPLNQYHVVMGVLDSFWQNPDGLKYIYVPTATGGQVPLSAFASFKTDTAPLQVNHSGQFPSVTISFNLLPGVSLGDAVLGIEEAEREIELPDTVHGSFSGTAQAYQDSLAGQPILIGTALLAVYIVLGILYESYIHPITILSTLPSAGVGALLALLMFNIPLSVIALIGILLLIGIVKKNAILMIDFALDAERRAGMTPDAAIIKACSLRFRPIIMTTMAALLGALPLALGTGIGSEMRRPLGIAIVGGLIFSQVLTLYTTPVIYVYLDRFRLWLNPPVQPKPVLPLPA
jgi:multidrug efflux pump